MNIISLLLGATILCSNIFVSNSIVFDIPKENGKVIINDKISNYKKNFILKNEDGNMLNKDFEEDLENCKFNSENYTIYCDVTVRNKRIFRGTSYYKRKVEIPLLLTAYSSYSIVSKCDGCKVNEFIVSYKEVQEDGDVIPIRTNIAGKIHYKKLIDCKKRCEFSSPFPQKPYKNYLFYELYFDVNGEEEFFYGTTDRIIIVNE